MKNQRFVSFLGGPIDGYLWNGHEPYMEFLASTFLGWRDGWKVYGNAKYVLEGDVYRFTGYENTTVRHLPKN